MTIYVNNANDVYIRNVRYKFDESVLVTNGNFLVSICEENLSVISGVSSHATNPVITTSLDLELEIGDRVFINRVLGTVSVNGFFDVTASGVGEFEIAADTDIETYLEGGKAWKVVEEQAAMTYDEELQQYLVTFEANVQFRVGQKYMILLQEPDLQYEIELQDSAIVRVR